MDHCKACNSVHCLTEPTMGLQITWWGWIALHGVWTNILCSILGMVSCRLETLSSREVLSFFHRFSIPALIYVCLLRFSDFINFYYEESYFIFYPIKYLIEKGMGWLQKYPSLILVVLILSSQPPSMMNGPEIFLA